MVATAIYSVTIVLWKETAFPLCRAMERRWKRSVVSRVSSVIVVIRLPISYYIFYPGTQFPGSEKITLLLLFVFGVVFLVDIWNMIEAFREAGLSSLDPAAKVPLDVLEMLLSCIFCALNKRLPNSAQIDVAESVQSLFSFLVCAYDVYAFNSSYFLCHPTHPLSMRIRVYVTQ